MAATSRAARRLRGLARLFRFELPLAAGLCVVLGQVLALGARPVPATMALGFAAIFCVSATALILNDWFDVETDRVNAPHRPLPSGEVSPRDALALSFIVAAVGLAASAALGVVAFIAALVIWIVGVLYNWRFKRAGLAGNLMVALSVGMTFVFGGISVGQPWSVYAWWFGAIAFLMDLGEEIAADAMDVEGDKLIGSSSLAIVHGREFALRVSALVFGTLVLVSVAPFVLGSVALIYLLPIAVMDVVTLYSAVRLLDVRLPNPRAHIRAIYLSGLAAVVIFLVLRLTVQQ
jgi:geranylgeranylglycerol-phosphate geranylgeranyltransferase